MCELCELIEGSEGFRMTICKDCHVPMVVLIEHRREFTVVEKLLIKEMFPGRRIRWDMRKIKEHGHCHIEG